MKHGISEKLRKKMEKENIITGQNITQDTTKKYANGVYKPISRRDAIIWNNIEWGGTLEEVSNDNLGGNESENGAVKVARNMYTDSVTSNVKSTLCYGEEWDAVLNFIDSEYSNQNVQENSIIRNYLDYGNYSGNLNLAGSNINFSIKNIFDLSGNVSEWTMEGSNDNMRVIRGGSCKNSLGISDRDELYPNDNFFDLGFRVALYINCH